MERESAKRILSLILFTVMFATMFAACKSKPGKESEKDGQDTAAPVAQWVIDPEIAAQAIDPIVRADFNENTNHYDISYADCFRIMRGGKYGIIDMNGEVVVEPEYDKLYSIRGTDDFLGVLTNSDGEKEQSYIHGDTFRQESAHKTYNSVKYEYYWNAGKAQALFVEVSGKDAKERTFSPSLPEVVKGVNYAGNKYLADGTYGLYCNSENVTGMVYEGAGCFADGKVAFKSNGKWGYLDSTGRTVIPFEYDAVWGYSALGGEDTPYECFDGFVTLCKNKKFGVMKDDGTVVASFIYDSATPVVDGKAFVKLDGSWGLISVDGSAQHIEVTSTTTAKKEKTTETTSDEETESTTKERDEDDEFDAGSYRTYFNISLRSEAYGDDDSIITKIDGSASEDGVSFYVDEVDGYYGHITYDGTEGWINLKYAEAD